MKKNSPFLVTFTHRPVQQGQFSIVAEDEESATEGAEKFLEAQGVEDIEIMGVQEVTKEEVQQDLVN